jgi:uncharacterized repeat protein (TIGR03803 family)
VVAIIFLALFALPATAQTLTVLHQFTAGGDGRFPSAGVIADPNGSLYGVTRLGGSFGYGAVFGLDANDKETVLHSFWSGDGGWPEAPLIRDRMGNLYGTTFYGGSPGGGGCVHGCGTVFKLDPQGLLSVLHAFSGGADGGNPMGGLIRDGPGNLYGTASTGGDSKLGFICGVVFKIDKKGNEKVLHAFRDFPDGCQPVGALTRDKDGNLYGATEWGGASKWGSVFKIDPRGIESVLYSFTNQADGGLPMGPLVLDAAGNLYGTANIGGGPMYGVVFKLDKAGKETVLYTFKDSPDGSQPAGGLVRDNVGNLYGATWFGGSYTQCDGSLGCGTLFEVDARGNESVLYNFSGKEDGAFPNGPLIRDNAGAFYGSTSEGGNSSCWSFGGGCGVVFKFVP